MPSTGPRGNPPDQRQPAGAARVGVQPLQLAREAPRLLGGPAERRDRAPTSPRAHFSGLPDSAVISAAISSDRSPSARDTWSSAPARTCAGIAANSSATSCAACTAASTSSAEGRSASRRKNRRRSGGRRPSSRRSPAFRRPRNGKPCASLRANSVLEDREALVEQVVGQRQRRQQPDDVAVGAAGQHDDAGPVAGRRDALGEVGVGLARSRLRRTRRPASRRARGRRRSRRFRRPAPADAAGRPSMPLGRRREVLGLHGLDRAERGGAGDRVAAVGAAEAARVRRRPAVRRGR